ncbi:hypothetical protein LTR62_002028 [Meristemomyces frigidus]|uniref:Uncharacterized protein n=1 Tax=Meristemomyces frigidus TaxID=1508187 RepID=A0AAN7YHR9_9PEZI|nr:hypothetical protein LTR62_002028 [Meristemomyces frigidus]
MKLFTIFASLATAVLAAESPSPTRQGHKLTIGPNIIPKSILDLATAGIVIPDGPRPTIDIDLHQAEANIFPPLALETMAVVRPVTGPMTVSLDADSEPARLRHDLYEAMFDQICDHHNKTGQYNKTQCVFRKCMRGFREPLNITTIFEAYQVHHGHHGAQPYTSMVSAPVWYTASSSLTGAHWGISESTKTYYPFTPTTTTNKHGHVQTAAVNIMPPGQKGSYGIHKAPTCYDKFSCCKECQAYAKKYHGFWRLNEPLNFSTAGPYIIFGLPLMLLALAMSCLLGCCLPFYKRRQTRAHRQALQDQNSTQVAEVVTTTTGNSINPAVAAGTGAAVAGSGADNGQAGQGTLSRRAEEGRGQVHFTDPATGVTTTTNGEKVVPAPSSAQTFTTHGGETVVTKPVDPAGKVSEKVVEPPVHAAEHAETVAVHDGAYDGASEATATGTGSEMADVGSVRGRKRAKQGRGDLLNLRF